ncbi:FAD dependent oxidoreductase [Pseudomonas cichorii]|uniref:FAD dependent oxidoreductase n=1 Tax=Pseudomonas cichorii TaxID=36746 RepID=A0A3M4M248_PSECI|nr:FAD-binding oxidoreductase [Pseudomonas cichorii]RMQ47779.1 FAD dependent oxidoreductase [Pseudomonas cichorii]
MFIDYEIAVIGAGIVGASIAAKLSSTGVSVALLDKGAAGALGSSGYSGGLVRLYDTDPLLMELAAYSIGLMEEGIFATTYSSALRRTGMIYRAAPDQLETIWSAIRQHAKVRYPMHLVGTHELDGVHYPHCHKDARVNLFEPRASVGNVRQAVASLSNVVRQSGLLLEHSEVQSIDCRSSHDVRIELGNATLRCRAVVVAAGAWSERLLPGMDFGLQTRSIPLARVMTENTWLMPIIDAVTQTYGIPLTRNIVQTGCGLRETGALPESLPRPDERHVLDASQRVQQLSASATDSSISVLDVLPGFDSYSPDGRPLLGFCAPYSPIYLATGMSGLGFKLAPGIAQIAYDQLRSHLAGQELNQDWKALSPARVQANATGPSVQP